MIRWEPKTRSIVITLKPTTAGTSVARGQGNEAVREEAEREGEARDQQILNCGRRVAEGGWNQDHGRDPEDREAADPPYPMGDLLAPGDRAGGKVDDQPADEDEGERRVAARPELVEPVTEGVSDSGSRDPSARNGLPVISSGMDSPRWSRMVGAMSIPATRFGRLVVSERRPLPSVSIGSPGFSPRPAAAIGSTAGSGPGAGSGSRSPVGRDGATGGSGAARAVLRARGSGDHDQPVLA